MASRRGVQAMSEPTSEAVRFQRMTILLLTLAVSIAFVGMIRHFMVSLFLAAVFSALAYPLHEKIRNRIGGGQTAAATLTLLLVVSIVLVPTLVMLNLIGVQAYELSQDVIPWVEQKFDSPQDLEIHLPEWFPLRNELQRSGPQVANKLGELAGNAGGFLVNGLSAATMGTANFFLQLFVTLYAMFYFLREGEATAKRVIGYAPLPRPIQELLVKTGVSVTRATLKGTLVIGLVQGALGGAAFAVVGIQGAAFWGAVMALSSVIPSVGTAIVWAPATLFLFVTGDVGAGVGLLLWCAIVVGGVDNILRPILVGGDTQMPDILILVSTFGGLTLFGVTGLIIGPVIAALFVTMWQVQHATFNDAFGDEDVEAPPA